MELWINDGMLSGRRVGGLGMMGDAGVAEPSLENAEGACVGGSRGWCNGAVMMHSMAGCEGAPKKLQARGELAVELPVQSTPVGDLVGLLEAVWDTKRMWHV